MPDSRQKQHASNNVPAKQPRYQNAAGRQHPYARPSVRAPSSHHQTSAPVDNRMRQAGPIRHSGNAHNSRGSSNSQLKFNHQQPSEPSAQQHVSKGFERPQTYSDFPQSSMPDDQDPYQSQQYSAAQSRQDLQYAAYVQRAATMHGPSPYLATSSNAYAAGAASHPATSVSTSELGRRPATGPIDLEQPAEFQAVENETEKPKTDKKKRATKAKGSNEEKKPSKSKVKGLTRFENGRLECVQDPDAAVQQWGESSFYGLCQSNKKQSPLSGWMIADVS